MSRDHYKVLRTVLDTGFSGWAAEFGVATGTSLSMIAEHMPVIGFDSFEGLPEDWREGFPKGMFASGPGIRAGFPPPNAMIVKGWFEDTAPGFPFPPLSLVHIDCDLYSSTVTALNAVWPHISVGTVFVFDEFYEYPGWEEHEAKAWDEFCTFGLITAELLVRNGEQAAFVVRDIGTR